MWRGDIRLGSTIDFKFTTRQISGAPFTLAGSPVVSAYVDNGTTQITAGITLSVDFDGVTGLNNVRVVATSGNGFATATNVDLVITTGTVNSVSVVGEVIGSFSIECRSALMPATAARTLVVDASGLADANVVKVGPTGSGTAQTAGDIMADTNDIQARLPAALVGGRMDSSTGAMAANVLTAAATAADFTTEIQTGLATPTNITGGTITTVTNLTNLPTIPANWLTAAGTAADFSAEVADAVWDEALAGHLAAGTTGNALNAAGSAGDPWTTIVPGAYGAGTAGSRIGRIPDLAAGAAGGLFIAGANAATTVNITGTITTVTTLTNLPAITANWLTAAGTAADFTTEMQAGLATAAAIAALNNLSAAQVNTEVDTAISDAALATAANLAAVAGYLDTEMAAALAAIVAVKAVTDLLPNAGALTNLDAAISTRATPAQVNAEVVDALATDTYPEPPQGTPAATLSLAAKINYGFKNWRNKRTQSATEEKIYADDGVTVDHKRAVSDDGTTALKDEIATGP